MMVIAAHPDDELLGCGGSLAKWKKQGHDIKIIIAGEGHSSRDNVKNLKKKIIELKKQSVTASKILGINKIINLGLPDNNFNKIDFLKFIKLIEKNIFNYKPEIILTHHYGDLNKDHRLLYEAVITACRPKPNFFVKKIMTFETLSSTDWQINTNENIFKPNYYEDITDFLKLKIKSLETYKSEIEKWPHTRSLQNIENLAKLRGSSVGLKAAEAFEIIRQIN